MLRTLLRQEIERIMELAPVTLPLFLLQTLNLLVTVVWVILMGAALVRLRRLSISEEAKVLWAGLIVILPFLGAIAFWVVAPGQKAPQSAQAKTVPLLTGPVVATARRTRVEAKGVEVGQAV